MVALGRGGVFYHWQRHLFERGALVFAEARSRRAESSREQQLLEENERLKARIAQKDQVIAEVTEELVKVKKSAGEP